MADPLSRKAERRVMIYRREILGFSETFILAQARAMRKYRPHLFGAKPIAGLDLEGVPAYTFGNGGLGRIQEVLFRYGGWGPALTMAARERRVSILHAHFAPDGAECLPLAESLGIPLIVTLHGWDVTITDDVLRRSRSGRKFLSLRQCLQRKASAFLCVSTFIREQAVKKGFPEKKLVVHYIGVDTDKLTPAPRQTREPIVLFVGRLVPKKGLGHLLRAMALVRNGGVGVKLVVIGDGPLRRQHEREAVQLGVDCAFIGAQPNHVVHDWMRRARILAFPSVRADSGDREGLGMVLCEAFALGLPAVAFKSGGIPDVVSDGCGLLATEGDFQDLARQLLLLLENDELRSRVAANARQRVVQNFNLAKQTEKLEQFYDDVVNEKAEMESGADVSLVGTR